MKVEIPEKKVYQKFKEFFGSGLEQFKDIPMMMFTGRFSFDIVGFDIYCQQYLGYDANKNGSLHDFVRDKYGNDAEKILDDLLHF